MAPDTSVHQTIGQRIHALTRKHEQSQLCRRKTTMAIAYRRRVNGYEEIDHCVNGPLNDDPNRCTNEVGGCGCIHSEFKMVIHLLRCGVSRGITLATTYSPCTSCANLIVISGLIVKCLWLEDTLTDMRGIEILQAGGLRAERIDPC